MKYFLKKFLKNAQVQTVICWFLASYIRLVMATNRIIREIPPEALPYTNGEKPAIFAFWHGRLAMFSAFKPPGRGMYVLISGHRDGAVISRIIGYFDIKTVTGSSSRGGAKAVRNIYRAIKTGANISITPDGPRGPNQQVAAGIVQVAKTSGLPMIPVTIGATRRCHLNSWDRFMIPLPFGRIYCVADVPIAVDETADAESLRQQLENTLNRITDRADALSKI